MVNVTKYYEDLKVMHLNREETRAYYIPYTSNSCGQKFLEKYRLNEKEFEFTLKIIPLFKED